MRSERREKSLTREEKQQLLRSLTAEFKDASAIAVCDYKGLSVASLEAIRNSARRANLRVQVIKNTLARIALKDAGKEGLELKETNIFVWGQDQVELAKGLVQFEKDNELFKIKVGFFDGEIVGKDQIVAISKLPSKEELIGMLLSVWSAPMRNMAYVLSAPMANFVTALDNLRIKNQQ